MALNETIHTFSNLVAQAQPNPIIKLIVITTIISLYALFIFKFYKLLAKRNLIELNLNKYNKYEGQKIFKIIATFFFVIEYIIILPFITFFWFAILTILLFILSESLAPGTIILLSASLIASVRITAYFSENLSQDLAKMLPFTLIGVAITKTSFFNLSNQVERLTQIPLLFDQIFFYLIFIIAIELIMRVYEFTTGVIREHNATTETAAEETEE
ncbi:MAG: hypothetical protein ACI83O_000161 [Patescibacteria group bacterium]|jgi:hypothetical protein